MPGFVAFVKVAATMSHAEPTGLHAPPYLVGCTADCTPGKGHSMQAANTFSLGKAKPQKVLFSNSNQRSKSTYVALSRAPVRLPPPPPPPPPPDPIS